MGGADPTHESNPDARFRSQNHAFVALDHAFVALIDGNFADAALRSGPHLLCRPGCTQCCIGVFAIGPADALRLRQGLSALKETDPERAARVQERAAASWSRLKPEFPGDAFTGVLDVDNNDVNNNDTDSNGDPAASFEDFANEEPCPALDPANGTCDLYASRPETCRVFGPPVAIGQGFGVCELCFQKATAQEVAKAAIVLPAGELSDALDQAVIAAGESSGSTVIAFVLNTVEAPHPQVGPEMEQGAVGKNHEGITYSPSVPSTERVARNG
jgi:Fe-S-cluster containining protein